MKTFRLIIHQRTYSDEDLLINIADYPEAKLSDVVEIYHANEEDNPRLLLQVKPIKEELQSKVVKDTISIEQSLASTFKLRQFSYVNVAIVNPGDVALDSVELTFKDQYMGRSEMWRLKNSLINTCVYINKKIEFCGGAVRCQVFEMWSQGDRVACGVITDDTKVVFRSSTSMVYLFLQMSSEMWDFDIHGDLYFEKAVNGFLTDLFTKWKKNGSNHEVTIVLFSRTFYAAKDKDEFPKVMRECLQQDYRGRFYEDFYRVVIQNERYDDWSLVLAQLRRVFAEYLRLVLECHVKEDVAIPKATNSTAAQGNFLEVLNMSLNVFEKHYLDRSFDRTGQLSVVITPGVGVFEVDRELTNITKQRIIDNGVGSDLVCVGEQPLHAVPLLKFHSKDTHLPDDYSMPHWINLSFYSTNKKIAYSSFVPRIKVPPMVEKSRDAGDGNDDDDDDFSVCNLMPDEEYIHNSYFDYDAYDAQVFQLPTLHSVHDGCSSKTGRYKRTSGTLLNPSERLRRRKLSDPDIQHATVAFSSGNSNRSQPITIAPAVSPLISPQEDKLWSVPQEKEPSPPLRMVVGSEGSPPFESRALINPFDPSHVTIKLTSNRRRWTHIFPKGPTGVLIQQHHYQAVPANQADVGSATATAMATHHLHGGSDCDHSPERSRNGGGVGGQQHFHHHAMLQRSLSTAVLHEYCKKRSGSSAHAHSATKYPPRTLTYLWGATGEQEWTPALTTGVDWKSLTIPACLPITTDYFPDKRSLQMDYVESLYSLLPDDVNAEYAQKRAIYKKPLTTGEVFRELISQRLAQGFQLVVVVATTGGGSTASSHLRKLGAEASESFVLSIGRLFHKIALAGSSISVTRYRPRHPYPGFKYQYRYRFHAPYHDAYEESFSTFTTEKLDLFNWNYMDHYICTRGDTDYVLDDGLKFWRFRICMLPLNNAGTKRILEGAPNCDIYQMAGTADHQQICEGFLKFIETVVNKFKRVGITKKPRMSISVTTAQHSPPLPLLVQPRRNSMSAVLTLQNAGQTNSPFRERLGSNRLPDRPRPRSGSKVMERGRVSPAVDFQQIENQSFETDDGNPDPILKSGASNQEILDAMKQSVTGVGFLTMHQSLPTATFVSADAANWLVTRMEGINSVEAACQILIGMHREKLICHASGDFKKPFFYGFYLYHIVHVDADEKDYCVPLGDLKSFENEWVEVEVRPALNWGMTPGVPTASATSFDEEPGVPHFLCDDISSTYQQADVDACSAASSPPFKSTHLEIDVLNKSDRVEWGHAKYQTVFRPDQAFEMVVEWLNASGSIVHELLYGWSRKAQQNCGLQMIPIPHDPLALPYSSKSDPLRGPIFVPLHIKCLEGSERVFKEFREETTLERIFLLQEAIVAKFGFIQCLMEPQNTAATQEHQYIHCTGTIFILLTSPAPKQRRLMSMSHASKLKYAEHLDAVPSPHEAYITRHVSGKNKDDYDNVRKMGFLWAWNHMVSRRWRTNPAVDNNFQLKLLRDFKDFCANTDNRLKAYWDDCWEAKEQACTTLNKSSATVQINQT